MKLGVNIDHVATLRNARGTSYPDPTEAAIAAIRGGADFITIHLREDRRHIKDEDLFKLKERIDKPINLEIAATEEMIKIALDLSPYSVCLVPEKRHELTTEGGLNVYENKNLLATSIKLLHQNGIKVTLFVDPNIKYPRIYRSIQVI